MTEIFRRSLMAFILLFSGVACFSNLLSTELTVSSYNAGSLPGHYDYIRTVPMQLLSQERYELEPEKLGTLQRIQRTALQILFSEDPIIKTRATEEWELNNYQTLLTEIVSPVDPLEATKWHEKALSMMSSYKDFPVKIYDSSVKELFKTYVNELNQGQSDNILTARSHLAKRIFQYHLNHDLIALQETNYLDQSLFPETHDVILTEGMGIAWNKQRFELLKVVEANHRALIATFRDRESGQIIALASGHLTGCDPFKQGVNPSTGLPDSTRGDEELKRILATLDQLEGTLKILAMDSNVTATHPRLNQLAAAEFRLDSENALEETCTNPITALNTRIDWIGIKSSDRGITITNIPVQNVGLNSPTTNISDHKPIAAKIHMP